MQGKKDRKGVTQKKAHAKTKATARKSRAQFRCPEAVGELIAFVNSIPPDRILPNPHDPTLADERGSPIKQMREKLDGLSVAHYARFGGLYMTYVNLRDCRRALRMLANAALLSPKNSQAYLLTADLFAIESEADMPEWMKVANLRFWPGDHTEYDRAFGVLTGAYPGHTMLPRIGSDRCLQHRPSTAVASLEHVNVDRVRVCAFCDLVFWANKSNQVTCHPQCGNARQQQLHRDRVKQAQYEQARKVKGRGPAKARANRQ